MEPIHIRRSNGILLVMVISYAYFIGLWGMHEMGWVDIDGASSLPLRIFICGFAVPATLGLWVIWSVRHRCVLSIHERHIEMRSGWLLNQALSVPFQRIETVSTNWQGPNSDSASDLIFTFDYEGVKIAENLKVLRQRDGRWLFLFATTEISPFAAVEFINARILRARS